MKTKLVKIFSLLFFIILSSQNIIAQEKGTVRGTITDKSTGETLIGVNIVVEGTTTGTVTDFDGNFNLVNIPAGTVILNFSYISYATQTISEVEIKDGEVTILNVQMAPASEEIEEVTVTAKQLTNSEYAILSMQKRAEGIQDGISSLEMKKFGSSNAAESMVKVTGVSVMNGKDIFVRGLGDRYSSVQMDGQQLPGTDPYKNSADIDLIPSNLLENIITSKTFTADLPGTFTGGNVNIKTKAFPEQFTLNFRIATAYNDQSSLNDAFLTFEGSETDWLGYDKGFRNIPDILKERGSELTSNLYIKARRGEQNPDEAALLDESVRSLNGQMSPTTMSTPLNQRISFSTGNQWQVFGNKQIGFVAGINYRRDFSFYNNGITANWELVQSGAESLGEKYIFDDIRATENPQVNGLATLAFKYSNNGSLELNYSYNHDAEKAARLQDGIFPAALSGTTRFQTRSLSFTERELQMVKLTGQHVFLKLNNTRVEFNGSKIASSQYEPDVRLFANSYRLDDNNDTTGYYMSRAEYDMPFHFWRELKDDQLQGKIDISIPFAQAKNSSNKIKLGGFYSDKERRFTETIYQYERNKGEPYNGNPDFYFGPENIGIIDIDNRGNNIIGNYIYNQTKHQNNYLGITGVDALYAMVTYNFIPKLKAIFGLRYETTKMSVELLDKDEVVALSYIPEDKLEEFRGEIDEKDFLPSVNLIYALSENMNVRVSGSQTIARPNLRELAPFASFDFIGGVIYNGNPNLERTTIQNYDVRWEWFVRPGELFAISAYSKQFKNPIILQYLLGVKNPQIQYQNTESGLLYGIELEARKNLDFVSNALRDFSFGFNFSLIDSKVDVNEFEQETAAANGYEVKELRPFPGQSPYLVNFNISYSNPDIGLNSTIDFNKFGDRMTETNVDTPDIYESSDGMLNFNLSKSFMKNFSVGFRIKNLLDSKFKKSVKYNNQDYIYQQYEVGRTYTLSLSYNIN
jgi:outer membrane receptor protein involved in Fe transport